MNALPNLAMKPMRAERRLKLSFASAWIALLAAGIPPPPLGAQARTTAYTWQEIRDKFVAVNPALNAARLGIDESRQEEVTAYLRPNPDFSVAADGFQITPNQNVWRPLSGVVETPAISYLHERDRKRELRRDSAKQSTAIAESTYDDQERSLIFSLRGAFVQVLQGKAFLENAQQNLAYWDRELAINRTRLNAGDIAQVDLDRLVLQRAQFESDIETSNVSLRTARIQLLNLLNDRTPVDRFDVTGAYDFSENLDPLDRFRALALETRPDLKAALQNVELAKINHRLAVSNGSTDPTYSVWWSHNPSFANPYANETVGGSISIPLRIFDRNQGEKARTEIDIARNLRLQEAARAQVFSDVDSAYVTIQSTVNLLRPYRDTYLRLAGQVRERVSFAFQNGGASLLDYLDAEKSWRDTRLAYLNLIGSYLSASAQLNEAVGREVLQ